MAQNFDLILRGGTVCLPAGETVTNIGVTGGRIAAIGDLNGCSAAHDIDCTHLHIMPGVIDSHVHFREPGLTHKEDISTGTLAAIAGGVTTIFEMPNTEPLTITAAAQRDKMARAAEKSWCDYAFYMGGCAGNADFLHEMEKLPGCAGVKVFMGSSTGDLLTADDENLLRIMQSGTRRLCLHAEDEARLIARKHIAEDGGDVAQHPVWRDAACALLAVKRAVALARKCARRLHFLHVTSADEMAYLHAHKDIATVETTPQHLTLFAPDCYEAMGTRAQMNPPIRDRAHRDALWAAVQNGTVDTLGSDHAPHTLDEKAKTYPASPSGMPGVQTLLPVMLNHVHEGRLSLARLVDLTAHGPQRVYGLQAKGRIETGYDADFAIVDLQAKRRITDRWIKSKCGWTPYDGMRVTGWCKGTVLRGKIVMWDDEIILRKPQGSAVRFDETLIESSFQDPENVQPPTHTCCS
ncbi:MAG: dihydroorotase [Bdellovibrionales bacterium]|jgi:dihydroorotase|nr:dihydroorotase [Bdellovibrionales bacterium]